MTGILITFLIIKLSNKDDEDLSKKMNISNDLLPWVHQFINEDDLDEKTRLYFYIYDALRSESLLDKSKLNHENILRILEKHKPTKSPYPHNFSKESNYNISISFE